MAKSPRSTPKEDAPRRGHARAAGDLVGDIAGVSFKRFGFVQGAVVSRWAQIVGERYANVSTPESVRFPQGKKSGGTLTLTVVGAQVLDSAGVQALVAAAKARAIVRSKAYRSTRFRRRLAQPRQLPTVMTSRRRPNGGSANRALSRTTATSHRQHDG